MAELLVLLFVALEIAAAVVHWKGRRALGGWLLTAAGATMCAGIVVELIRGVSQIGLGADHAYARQLEFYLVALVMSLTAALKPRWRILFWLAWAINALICAGLVYLAFFWKVFH